MIYWLFQISDSCLTQPNKRSKQTISHHAEEIIHRDRQLLFFGLREPIQQSGGKVCQTVLDESNIDPVPPVSRMSVRRASHANSWYSGNASQLDRELSSWLSVVAPLPTPARAVICPHAGYSYSGPTAAYRSVTRIIYYEIRDWHVMCLSVSDRLTRTLWRQSSSWALVTMWGCLAAPSVSVSRTKPPSEISPSTETSTRNSWTQVRGLTS